MANRKNIALYDPIVRRRAALCFQLSDTDVSVFPFEHTNELRLALQNNLSILIYDDPESTELLVEDIYRLGINAPIIAYSDHPEPQRVAKLIFDGVADYLPIDFDKEMLMMSLAKVDVRSHAIGNTLRAGHRARGKLALLTPREQDVLFAVAEGLSNNAIGKRLGISPRTAEVHRANVIRKLEAKTSAEAVRIAFEAKLVGMRT